MTSKILKKSQLSENVFRMKLEAPLIARERKAGQFIILRCDAGMCGGCRVSVGGETKFVCVDGPEFDAHQVDFDSFINRLGAFKSEETEHKCRSGLF